MMVQDQYSGYIHEVPEPQMGYGLGEVVYDGFGNAVGWNPFDTIRRVVSAPFNLARNVAQGVGNLAQGAIQNVGNLTQGAQNLVGQPRSIAARHVGTHGRGFLSRGLPGGFELQENQTHYQHTRQDHASHQRFLQTSFSLSSSCSSSVNVGYNPLALRDRRRFALPPLLRGNALPDQSGFPHKRHSDLRLAFSPLHLEQRLYIFPVNH